MFGSEVGSFNLGVSLVQTSRLSEDRVINLQLSPRGSGFSVGVQDLLDETRTTPNFYESAQTFYAASTYENNGVYLSGGVGTKRFSKGFGSVSAPLVRNTRAMVEHDGFGWNYGVEVQVFDVATSRASLFVGSCQGRYATWAVSWKF
jgi:hypothetical protein